MSSLGKTLPQLNQFVDHLLPLFVVRHSSGSVPRCGVKMLIQIFSAAGFADQNARKSRRYPGRLTMALVMVQWMATCWPWILRRILS